MNAGTKFGLMLTIFVALTYTCAFFLSRLVKGLDEASTTNIAQCIFLLMLSIGTGLHTMGAIPRKS